MIIKTFVEGPINANNYLLIDEESKEAALIDCSSAREGFIEAVRNAEVNLKYILLTHGHFDHILGCDKFIETFGCKAYLNEQDLSQIKLSSQMAMHFLDLEVKEIKKIENYVNDGDEFYIGKTCIKAISTPGHTKGGMSYIVDEKLFSGDTLFKGSVGRTDLAGGDWKELLHSVRDKLFLLPDNTEVFPGHEGKTILKEEKAYNEIINI